MKRIADRNSGSSRRNVVRIGAGVKIEILEIEPGFLSEDHHEHDDEVQSFVFTTTDPFDQERLQAFFRELIADHAPNLLRYKGVVAFERLDQQVVFQGVHMMMEGSNLSPGKDGAKRQQGQPETVKCERLVSSLPLLSCWLAPLWPDPLTAACRALVPLPIAARRSKLRFPEPSSLHR